MKRYWALSLLLVCVLAGKSPLSGQTLPPGWESFLGEIENDETRERIIALLEQFLETPLNVNQADEGDFLLLPGFPPELAHQIIEFRRKYGPIKRLEDLHRVLNIDEVLWNRYRPLLKIERPEGQSTVAVHLRSRIINPVEKPKGIVSGQFPGNAIGFYNRCRMDLSSWLKIGLLTEKDHWEKDWNDHAVGFAQVTTASGDFRAVAGNYLLQLGTGILIGSPLGFGSTISGEAGLPSGKSWVQPYLSGAESGYNRGLGMQYQRPAWQMIAWWSDCPADANVENGRIQSFYESGLHRTDTERSKENRAAIRQSGISLSKNLLPQFSIQGTVLQARFSPPLLQKDAKPEAAAAILSHLTGGSLFVSWQQNRHRLLAEVATLNQKMAATVLLRTADRGWAWTIGYRRYPRAYPDWFAQGIRAGSRTQNESGWFCQIRLSPFPGSSWTIGADRFVLGSQPFALRPSRPAALLAIRAEQKVSRAASISIRYYRKERPEAISVARNGFNLIEDHLQTIERWRIRFHCSPSAVNRVLFNIETARASIPFADKMESGQLLGLTHIFSPWSGHRLTYQVTFFETPSFPVRLYQYEYDLPGRFSINLLYGKGVRFSGLYEFQPRNELKLSFRFSATEYLDRTHVGTGWDQIRSAIDRQFSFQIDWNVH